MREGTKQQQPLMCSARTWKWRAISKGDPRYSTEGKDATSCQQQREGLKETQKAGSPTQVCHFRLFPTCPFLNFQLLKGQCTTAMGRKNTTYMIMDLINLNLTLFFKPTFISSMSAVWSFSLKCLSVSKTSITCLRYSS